MLSKIDSSDLASALKTAKTGKPPGFMDYFLFRKRGKVIKWHFFLLVLSLSTTDKTLAPSAYILWHTQFIRCSLCLLKIKAKQSQMSQPLLLCQFSSPSVALWPLLDLFQNAHVSLPLGKPGLDPALPMCLTRAAQHVRPQPGTIFSSGAALHVPFCWTSWNSFGAFL